MLSISSCPKRQQCRPEHQKEERENGYYALSLGFPEAGETNDKSGVLHTTTGSSAASAGDSFGTVVFASAIRSLTVFAFSPSVYVASHTRVTWSP